MELQFGKSMYDCLQLWAEEVKSEELTQEMKLPEAMPDIGTVLGAWGQILMRGKEWRGNGMSVTGGVMTWVVYVPEDGSVPRTVEGWLPFQLRWDFPETQRDGKILAACQLRSVDARCTAARKLMVRAGISIQAEALEPSEFTLFTPEQVPEDVRLLRRQYPVCFPAEAGEKIFQLDEELSTPSQWAGLQKLLRYEIQPELIDRKIMADKVVFRGMALVRGLARCEDGSLRSASFEVPFSQYAQLDREYGPDAQARLILTPTALELDRQEDGRLRLKAGITGQYVIYDTKLLELVEDAYSPVREVQLQQCRMEMPMVLDMRRETVHADQQIPRPEGEPVDVGFALRQCSGRRTAEGMELELQGAFQALCGTESGSWQPASGKWESSWKLTAEPGTKTVVTCIPTGEPQGNLEEDILHFRADMAVEAVTMSGEGLTAVQGLTLGELQEPDPGRPALILRRSGGGDLWELAKAAGSTVEAIRRANDLQEEPRPGQMLLIPVL